MDVVIDLVGISSTLLLASKISRPMGRVALVGIGGGTLTVGWGHLDFSPSVAISASVWVVQGKILERFAN